MDQGHFELLKAVSEVHGTSGHEHLVAKKVVELAKPFSDKIDFDNLGSVIAFQQGRLPNFTVMLSAHMDEVGFIINKIEDSGFIRFSPIGGWWGHVILAQVMAITTRSGKSLIGVVGAQPPHGMSSEMKNRVLDIKDMYVDLGVSNKKMVEDLGISVGDFMTPHNEVRVMHDEKTLLGKAWDDRLGVAIVLETLKQLQSESHPATIAAAFTVQEEVGLRGAKTAAYRIKPDVAFAIDVTMSYDVPTAPKNPGKLGSGVALSLLDGSVIAHRGLFDYVENLAKKNNIRYAYDLMTVGGTDAGEIHKQFDGVVTMTLSIPCRYYHSHVSMIHYDDFLETVKLLKAILLDLTPKKLAQIRETKYQ
jgi:endoglucanase